MYNSDDNKVSLYIELLGEITMVGLNLVLLVLLAGELFILCSNLSSIRRELNEREGKLTSELSEIKKLLEK